VALLADLAAPDVAALQAARSAGFSAAAVPAPEDAAALEKLLAEHGDFIALVYLTPEQVDWPVAPAQAVLRSGVWPGIAPADPSTAGATEHAWLDANTSLIAQLRAMQPHRRAVLGYRPDKAAGVAEKRSLAATASEVVLADAFSAGGSVILSVPPDYRRGLLAGEARATDAWKSLCTVQAFIRAERAASEAPLDGRLAVLCGTLEQTGEILNLAFRKNLCPLAFAPAALPELSPACFDLVVAANIEIQPAVAENLARFAVAGGAVVAAPAGDEKSPWWTTRGWKKLRTEQDRDVFQAGKGLVYAYHDPILEPGAFAVDVKELAGLRTQPGFGVKNLPLRVWVADTVLGVLHRTSPKSVIVVLTAYGFPPRHDFLVSVRGRFRHGTIRQVGAEPKSLPLMIRPDKTEINLTSLSRIAILTLEE
jgi:hypothetical protein